MLFNCKTCNKPKTRINIGLNKVKWVDENNKLWAGYICPECYSEFNKAKYIPKERKTYPEIACGFCSKMFIPLIKHKVTCSKECSYKYNYKNNKTYYQEYSIKKRSKLSKDVECLQCKKLFNTYETRTRNYCSKECQLQKLKDNQKNNYINKTPIYNCKGCLKEFRSNKIKEYCTIKCSSIYKKKNKPEKLIKLSTCRKCSTEFMPLKFESICSLCCYSYCKICNKKFKCMHDALYCSRRCSRKKDNKRKVRESFRKRGILTATPRWVDMLEMCRIYDEKPKGHDVDHIIPLNHPDVCGLNVPWNLQYLTRAENSLKSNKFDFTNENKSWKVINF